MDKVQKHNSFNTNLILLNKDSWTVDRGYFPSLGVGQEANNPQH